MSFLLQKIKEVKHLLRKPALQYPHAEVVNPNEEVDFQCELQSSGKIAKARLMIDDNNYEYYFDNFDIQNLQENNYSSLVTYLLRITFQHIRYTNRTTIGQVMKPRFHSLPVKCILGR